MFKNSIGGKTENVNKKEEIVVRQKELPFVILPKAVFLLKRNSETQRYSLFRLIVLLGYLYSLAMTREKMAKTSYSELKKILNLKSKSTLQELFKFLEREGIVSERVFHFKTSQKTEIILINSMEIPYVAQSWSEEKVREDLVFKVPKFLYVLPISPFSKAVYMYLCSLRQYASQSIIRTTTREIREALRMKKKNIILALNELENHSLIKTVRTKKETRIEILPTDKWSSELLAKARELYPDHPLLSTGTNKEPQGTNREPPGTNKEPQEYRNTLKEKGSKQALEDYLEDIEDYIEDAANNNNINNGGEKKENRKISKGTENNKTNIGLDVGNSKNRKVAKLGRANNKVFEKIDEVQLSEICKKVKFASGFLRYRCPEFFAGSTKKMVEDSYSGVLKVYGEECGYLLAVMYELLAKEKKLGYSPDTIKNPSGFLISFAYRDSHSDFEEFFKKFLRKFGLLEEYEFHCSNKDYCENDAVLFECLKATLRKKMTPVLYRSIEKCLLGVYRREEVTTLICKDRITVELLKKSFLQAIEEALPGRVEILDEISARINKA